MGLLVITMKLWGDVEISVDIGGLLFLLFDTIGRVCIRWIRDFCNYVQQKGRGMVLLLAADWHFYFVGVSLLTDKNTGIFDGEWVRLQVAKMLEFSLWSRLRSFAPS